MPTILVRARAYLYNKFKTGAKPTEADFSDLVNSYWHKTEDQIPVERITGLDAVGGKTNEAITVAGVGRVGNLADGDIIAQGTSVTEFVRSLLSRRILYAYRRPTASIRGTSPQVGEQGAQQSVTVSLDYQQNDAGPISAAYIVFQGHVIPLNADGRSATVSNFIFQNYPQSFVGEAGYSDGPIINDTLGTPTPGHILAGAVDSDPLAYTSVLPWFYGSAPTANVTSAMVYSGNKVVASVGTELNISSFGADGFLWFAVPSGSKIFTQWFRSELNKGNIGAASDLFSAHTSPYIESVGLAENWGNNYDIYVTNYSTGSGVATKLS